MLIVPESLKGVLAVLMCLALIVWSAVPSFTHSPAIFETIQDQLEMVEDHGHSHGFEEDLYWAMHGHSHDTADHDHKPRVRAALRRLSQVITAGSGETAMTRR